MPQEPSVDYTAELTGQLRSTLGKLEIALSAVEDAIVWTDAAGDVQWCNRAFDQLVGRTHITILGQSLPELLPLAADGQPQASAQHPVMQVLRAEYNMLHTFERQTQDARRVLALTGRRIQPTEQDISAIFVIRDVTVQRQAEQQTQEAMAIKEEFTSMVSHELRTPLAVILEGIDLVLDGTAGTINEEQRDFLDTVKRNVDRLSRLIHDVLDYQKLELGRLGFHMAPQDVAALARETIEAFLPVAQKHGLTLRSRIADGLPLVVCDRDKIIQVLMNLLNNALKFSERGTITVSVEPAEGAVRVAVRDEGPGIKAEDLSKLFHSFSQLGGDQRKTGGTGLGLAISKRIVQRHGGRVGVESEYGKGSTFYAILPLSGGVDHG